MSDSFHKIGIGGKTSLLLFKSLFGDERLVDFALKRLAPLLIGIELAYFWDKGECNSDDNDAEQNAENDSVDQIPIFFGLLHSILILERVMVEREGSQERKKAA